MSKQEPQEFKFGSEAHKAHIRSRVDACVQLLSESAATSVVIIARTGETTFSISSGTVVNETDGERGLMVDAFKTLALRCEALCAEEGE